MEGCGPDFLFLENFALLTFECFQCNGLFVWPMYVHGPVSCDLEFMLDSKINQTINIQ